MSEALQVEIAQAAAPWVLEHGLDFGAAKRKAIQAMGLPDRSARPTNAQLEAALIEHIQLFMAERQATELLALRQLALKWMRRLTEFRPHLTGAVWAGWATQNQPICLQLFADNPKMVDIWMLNADIEFHLHQTAGASSQGVPALSFQDFSGDLQTSVQIVLVVHEYHDLRRAKRLDERGLSVRGDLAAVMRLGGIETV